MAKVLARTSADVVDDDDGVALVETEAVIGSEGVADATAVTLHPNTNKVDVKSCAIRPWCGGRDEEKVGGVDKM